MPENTQAYPFTTGTPNAAWIPGGQAAGTTSANTKGQFGTAQVGDADYWLPIWSGEILNAYDQYNIFEPLVSTKAITSGTTMRFPITGTVGMKAQWKAGEELVGSTGATSPQWFDISLDSRPMASHFELDDISLMLSQWEYRSEMARQSGLALANARDKQIACLIAQAAFMPNRDPAVDKGGNFGTATAGASDLQTGFDLPAHTDFNLLGEAIGSGANRAKAALKFLEYLEIYMVRLQEIDAPTEGVYASVTPQAFQDIRALGIARSTDSAPRGQNMQPMFGGVAEAGGLGAPYTQGMNSLTDTLEYMGVTIVKTNHMPEQTVELDGTTYAVVAASAAGNIDSELLDIGPSTATTVGLKADGTGTAFGVAAAGAADELSAIKLGDVGDAKYNFDWCQFSTIGSATGNGFDAMFPVKALIWQKDAVAALNFQGLKVDTVQDVRRNTTFTVASKMSGGGVLRPELCAAVCGASVV